MSDRIIVNGIEVVAHHGVLPEEAVLGQRFALDLTAYLDLAEAGRTDDVAFTVSYAEIVEVASAALTSRRYNLLEAAAEAVATALLSHFPLIWRVGVDLRKPNAPISAIFGYVAVSIERGRPDE